MCTETTYNFYKNIDNLHCKTRVQKPKAGTWWSLKEDINHDKSYVTCNLQTNNPVGEILHAGNKFIILSSTCMMMTMHHIQPEIYIVQIEHKAKNSAHRNSLWSLSEHELW